MQYVILAGGEIEEDIQIIDDQEVDLSSGWRVVLNDDLSVEWQIYTGRWMCTSFDTKCALDSAFKNFEKHTY